MADNLSHNMGASYSQGHSSSVLASQTWRTAENSAGYLLPLLTEGMRVLDVGCGTGTITIDLASRVAPGEVVGVDVEESVLQRGRDAAAERAVPNVSFVRGDVNALAATGDGFDVVHAHQVLLHVADPVAALRGMIAAARPGGIVAARDADYGAVSVWPHDPRLDRWLEIYRAVSRRGGSEPDAGRRLKAWAHAAGAHDVVSTASIWCHSSPEERAWWGGSWAERIVHSTIAGRAVEHGLSTPDELQEISAAWRRWADDPDGWFAIPHGEIVCRV